MGKKEVTVRGNFDGVVFIDGVPHLSYSKLARRTDGLTRHVASCVPIHRPEDLIRLQTEFQVGDLIRVTEETDWSADDLPVILKHFDKVEEEHPVSAEAA